MAQDRLSQLIPPLAVPLAAALVMYGVVLFAPQVLYDADTFWHITAGQRMLDLRQVIHADPFSHTMPGKPWQTHEWLAEIVMALSYRAAGWNGIVILGGLAAGAAAMLTGWWLSRFMPPLSSAITLILGFATLTPSLLVRPHLLALPIMAGWVIALMLARERGKAPPLWLALVMIVWANLHGSYVFGLVLIGPFALEALIVAPRERWLDVIWRWGLFGVLCLAACLITPHGLEGLIFPFQLMTMKSLPNIVEWRPPDLSKLSPLKTAIFATLFIALSRGVRMPVLRLIVLLGLFYMATQHIRHVVVLGVIGPLLLAQPLGRALEPDHRADLRREWKFLGLVAAVALLGATGWRFIDPLVRKDGYHAPISAYEATPADLRKQPVLNSYGLGGYLIFKGTPVFIDGRADMYGDAFMKDYMQIARGDQKAFDAAVKRYGIRWAFIETGTPMAKFIARQKDWRRLHGDKIAQVFVREPYPRSTSLPSSTTR
ncbi:MAG TPA: hypothetical protein VF138_00945 [Caulobacteraceae bacterium]